MESSPGINNNPHGSCLTGQDFGINKWNQKASPFPIFLSAALKSLEYNLKILGNFYGSITPVSVNEISQKNQLTKKLMDSLKDHV